ncbi:MAG: hypothetical protein FWC57_03005 [Endomicrobia bacterium]|nr:hypothetical protein [Endomicrobiia bacterium]
MTKEETTEELGRVHTITRMRLAKTSPNARRGDEAIVGLLIGAATPQLGLF